MCHRIALRERGKTHYELQMSPYDSVTDAINAGKEKITNSAFDSFELWARTKIFEAQVHIKEVEPAAQADTKTSNGVTDDRESPQRLASRESR